MGLEGKTDLPIYESDTNQIVKSELFSPTAEFVQRCEVCATQFVNEAFVADVIPRVKSVINALRAEFGNLRGDLNFTIVDETVHKEVSRIYNALGDVFVKEIESQSSARLGNRRGERLLRMDRKMLNLINDMMNMLKSIRHRSAQIVNERDRKEKTITILGDRKAIVALVKKSTAENGKVKLE